MGCGWKRQEGASSWYLKVLNGMKKRSNPQIPKMPQTVSSRFPENARKLEDLKPTWFLKDGIGCLDKVIPFRTSGSDFQIFLG